MFVLGIDPGLTRCGYGLVEGSFLGVESFRAVRAGTIETDHEQPVELRLGQMLIELRTLMEETTPDAVVVERVFYQRNAHCPHFILGSFWYCLYFYWRYGPSDRRGS